MSGIRLKYVHQWVDKRDGGAKARFYFRRPGFKGVPLPGLPGSAEFMAAYQAALTGQLPSPPIGASRTKAGSISALIIAFWSSPQFLALAPATKQTYRLILEKFRAEHGDKPVALLTRKHITSMLAAKVNTPAAANHWLRLIKTLMAFAVEEGFRPDNPTLGMKRIKAKVKGFHTWTEGEIAAFEGYYPIGTKARLAFALLLFTAVRRSDVVTMGRQHIQSTPDGDVIHLPSMEKTEEPLTVPLHPDLAAVIDATPNKHLTFLVTEYGQPFTANGFGGWFRARCDEAGLPQCSAHGLRKATARRLADLGKSANAIAAVLGHKGLRMAEVYTKDADRRRMAREAMAAITRTKTGNGAERVAKSAKKS